MKMRRQPKTFLIRTLNRLNPLTYNRIHILFPQKSKGLQHDASMLGSALGEGGFRTRFVDVENYEPLLKSRVNIFLEQISTRYLSAATHNIHLPNPEWDYHDPEFLRTHIELLIAKTHDCEKIFSEFMPHVAYSSFTSPDIGAAPSPQTRFVHFAGKSQEKGTASVINTWNTYPGLPRLDLYSYRHSYENLIATSNISYHSEYVSDATIRQLQHKYLFHICPSEYEGFGHQINEAKSAGAIVLTTNAPPMNELITKEFGFLISAEEKGTKRKAPLHKVSESDLYYRLVDAESLAPAKRQLMRTQARNSFLENDAFFRRRVKEIIDPFF